jgi:catechol 2,3-dioxygenase-like lactoylglutathione lyase family enzyme
MPRLLSAGPISGEDLLALPVKSLAPALEFYRQILGFAVEHQEATTATVARDGVRLGLLTEPGHDPGRAGSMAIEVDDLDALHREFHRANGHPGEFGVDEWNGRSHRTFFLVEQINGYCYCFFTPLA